MRYLALLSVLALTLAACGGGSTSVAGAGTGTLRVMVTDDPFPFPAELVASATVKIIRVEARNADLEGWQVLYDGEAIPEPDPEPDPEPEPPAEPPAEPADPEPEPEPLGPVELDLKELAGGVSTLLVEIEVPTGTYDEVRLIVDAGTVVLTEGAHVDSAGDYPDTHTFTTEAGNLRFPSGAQTGIKVKIDNDIVVESQLTSDLMLEFDLANNFVFNGTPERDPGVKRINFTPVVRATNTTVNGTITLAVKSDEELDDDPSNDLPIPFPTVVVSSVTIDETTSAEVETVLTTLTGAEDGTITFSAPAGTVNLDVLARGYDPAALDGIPVTAANVYDAGTVALDQAEFWLEGQVFEDVPDPETDSVFEGATVELWTADPADDGATQLETTTTNASGLYVFTGFTPGTYFVRALATGYETAGQADVEVEAYVIPEAVDFLLAPTP